LVAKKLSTHLKKVFGPQIDDRDGKNCFYCELPFQHVLWDMISISKDPNPKEFDHLNNDEEDNRLENLVHAHRFCNQRKKNDNEWIVKAKKKLRDNERSASIPVSHANTQKETATETDTNAIFSEIVLKELANYLMPKANGEALRQEIPLKEFLDLVAGKGYKECGHASQNTMRRIIDMFTTTEFPYIKVKDNKKSIIRLRTEDDKDIFQQD
jgi:hypothetical protein